MMKIRYKAPLITLGVTLIMTAISGYFSYATSVKLIETAKLRELQNASTLIRNDMIEQSTKASARSSMVVNLLSIQEAFRAGDREQLAQRLLPAFLLQREKYGVREGQFSLPPATSFLRIFDLTNFGEDLSSFREMVLMANTRQEPQDGVEVGRRGLSIRGANVVKDDQGLIGVFEVGMGFSPVLENIKKIPE